MEQTIEKLDEDLTHSSMTHMAGLMRAISEIDGIIDYLCWSGAHHTRCLFLFVFGAVCGAEIGGCAASEAFMFIQGFAHFLQVSPALSVQGRVSSVECRGSRVEGRGLLVEGRGSRVEGRGRGDAGCICSAMCGPKIACGAVRRAELSSRVARRFRKRTGRRCTRTTAATSNTARS
eukprot:130509-Rhodomonas_salina.1